MTQVNSIDAAKTYTLKATSRYLSEDEAQNKLSQYRSALARATTDEEKALWTEQLDELEQWLSCDAFRNRTYPQGLDDLVLDLADWRATVSAFQNVKIKHELFNSSHFFAQWKSGAAYAIACIVGKLVSRYKSDNSLINLWEKVLPFLNQDKACTPEEVNVINRYFDKKSGHFTNNNSKAMLLRNKMIAHNEWSPRIAWVDLDHDIEILARVWALLVGFCSSGLLFPFSQADSTFAHLGSTVSPSEFAALKKYRAEFLEKFKTWTRKSLATGELDIKPRAFAEISVSMQRY